MKNQQALDKNTQSLCKQLVEKYKKTGDAVSAQRVRNELFAIILPFMQKWLKSHLAKRKIFLKPATLLSACWEAFCYCLENYHRLEVPMPSHFHRNINYFVLKCLQSKKKLKRRNEVPLEETFAMNEEDSVDENPIMMSSTSIISGVSFLKEFRDSLDEEYKFIFDDALMGSNTRLKIATNDGKDKKISSNRYKEAKKIFQMLTIFLLQTISEDNPHNIV